MLAVVWNTTSLWSPEVDISTNLLCWMLSSSFEMQARSHCIAKDGASGSAPSSSTSSANAASMAWLVAADWR